MAKPCHLSSKSVAREKKITEPSTETHKIPFLVSSTEVIIG